MSEGIPELIRRSWYLAPTDVARVLNYIYIPPAAADWFSSGDVIFLYLKKYVFFETLSVLGY